ncbi:hypothetical protein [uncultured Muribaculum sp.]|uniref:hypothetical protein n=1 Tax=uncultured Muribaculum sp. TaxID=1918613 RepID=UPI0025B7660A|nr:hypothetical protein [uncultured Muribaculum sp.]
MKKKILSLALVAMSFVTFSSMAQTATSTADGNKKERMCREKADCQQKRECRNPFAGLNLTEAQQAKLKELNDHRKTEKLEAAKARKESKQRLDSTRIADRRASKKAYLEEVKAIIGPDQYVMFLENFYVNGGNSNKAAMSRGKAAKAREDKAFRSGRHDKAVNRHHASAKSAKAAKSAKSTTTTDANANS